MRILILAVTLFSSSLAVGATVDVEGWKMLLQKVITTGNVMTAPDGSQYRALSNLVPNDDTVPHKADYFSAVGSPDGTNNFTISSVSVVSENWQKQADGNWQVDQWIFAADTQGNLTSVSHGLLLESADFQYLGYINAPNGGLTDPAVQTEWLRDVNNWISRLQGS